MGEASWFTDEPCSRLSLTGLLCGTRYCDSTAWYFTDSGVCLYRIWDILPSFLHNRRKTRCVVQLYWCWCIKLISINTTNQDWWLSVSSACFCVALLCFSANCYHVWNPYFCCFSHYANTTHVRIKLYSSTELQKVQVWPTLGRHKMGHLSKNGMLKLHMCK